MFLSSKIFAFLSTEGDSGSGESDGVCQHSPEHLSARPSGPWSQPSSVMNLRRRNEDAQQCRLWYAERFKLCARQNSLLRTLLNLRRISIILMTVSNPDPYPFLFDPDPTSLKKALSGHYILMFFFKTFWTGEMLRFFSCAIVFKIKNNFFQKYFGFKTVSSPDLATYS